MRDRDRLALLLILFLGAALRLFHVDAPFLDSHAWRQLDTAAMARNFFEDGFLPFDPQVDWGGSRGYLEAEFPLVPAIDRARLPHRRPARGARTLDDRRERRRAHLGRLPAGDRPRRQAPVARAAAFLIAVSPMAVFFGRIVIPDTPMMLALVLALVGYVEYAYHRSTMWLAIGTLSLTIACLLSCPRCFSGRRSSPRWCRRKAGACSATAASGLRAWCRWR